MNISTATWLAKNQQKDGVKELPWDDGGPWMMREYDEVDLSLIKQMRSRGMIKPVESDVRHVNAWVISDNVRQYYLDKYSDT